MFPAEDDARLVASSLRRPTLQEHAGIEGVPLPLGNRAPGGVIASTSRRELDQDCIAKGSPRAVQRTIAALRPQRKLRRHRVLCEWWVTRDEPGTRRPRPRIDGRRRGGSHMKASSRRFGTFLMGANGTTLYTHAGDDPLLDIHGRVRHGVAASDGGGGWRPTAGAGVTERLGTLTRADSTMQVMSDGLPPGLLAGRRKAWRHRGRRREWPPSRRLQECTQAERLRQFHGLTSRPRGAQS